MPAPREEKDEDAGRPEQLGESSRESSYSDGLHGQNQGKVLPRNVQADDVIIYS